MQERNLAVYLYVIRHNGGYILAQCKLLRNNNQKNAEYSAFFKKPGEF